MPNLQTTPNFITKQELVYHSLREEIMRVKLVPGQRLVIQNLANRFNVSAIPVREALQLLHSENLIEYRSHIGAIVSPISRASIVETFTVKEGLETVAARVASEHMTDDSIARLHDLVNQMDLALQAEDHERWGDINTDFHKAIADIAEMPMLQDMTKSVLDKWDRIRRYLFTEVLIHRQIQSQEEHHLILQALSEQKGDYIQVLVREHNRSALKDYLDKVN